jgi:hypothetical protein
MARIIKTLIIFIFLALMAANPARALMADVFEVNHSQAKPVRILKGEVYQQSFLSTADSFGIIAVKFSNNNKINQDVLTFRIKEENDKDWFYENQYKTDQFQNNQFFTFGFPKINDTQGKTFVFEIESLVGTEDDSVSVFLTPEKDLVFKLIKEEPAKKLIIQDLQLRFRQDPLFFYFWLSIITVTAFAVIILAKKS